MSLPTLPHFQPSGVAASHAHRLSPWTQTQTFAYTSTPAWRHGHPPALCSSHRVSLGLAFLICSLFVSLCSSERQGKQRECCSCCYSCSLESWCGRKPKIHYPHFLLWIRQASSKGDLLSTFSFHSSLGQCNYVDSYGKVFRNSFHI